jgi:hypothetical protein
VGDRAREPFLVGAALKDLVPEHPENYRKIMVKRPSVQRASINFSSA